MVNAQLLHPHVNVTTAADGTVQITLEQSEFIDASRKTARAISSGVALAAMDGPLPIMDVVGFGVAVTGAALAWYDYFN